MLISSRIKELRINRGLSQEDLGKMIGVTKVSVCGYENATRVPSLESLALPPQQLQLRTDYLLRRELLVVSDKSNKYMGAFSEQDVEIIRELKRHPNIYRIISEDPKRTISRINKKM